MAKEKKTKIDFPFYKDPNIKVLDIFALAIVPLLFTVYIFTPLTIPGGFGPYVFCGLQLAAFLFVSRGKISLLIKKPKAIDFLRVLGTLILQWIIAIGISALLQYAFRMDLQGNGVLDLEMDSQFWLTVAVQLFGEELYKILLFLAALAVMYKLTKKRRLSIGVATAFSLLCFAIMHLTTYSNIIHVLLLQGFASLICMYNYLKTKNILMPYLQHLLFDAVPFVLISALSSLIS